jgi:hypothetical protein
MDRQCPDSRACRRPSAKKRSERESAAIRQASESDRLGHSRPTFRGRNARSGVLLRVQMHGREYGEQAAGQLGRVTRERGDDVGLTLAARHQSSENVVRGETERRSGAVFGTARGLVHGGEGHSTLHGDRPRRWLHGRRRARHRLACHRPVDGQPLAVRQTTAVERGAADERQLSARGAPAAARPSASPPRACRPREPGLLRAAG